MTKINLLDWRAQRRELRKRRFVAMMAAAAAVAGLVLTVAFLFVDGALDGQNARNEYLSRQIAEVDEKIKEIQELERVKSNLLARMRVIESLQASRSASVHFFDELVQTLPEGVTLTAIKQTGTEVTLEGAAESNGRVSSYMKNLEASPWFENPQLVVIKTSDAGPAKRSDFTLRVKNLTKPATPDEGVQDEEIVE